MVNFFKCCITFEDVHEMFTICYVCRKYLCMTCHNKHTHNNIETHCENLVDIIKEKNDALYKPIPICDWNTSFDKFHYDEQLQSPSTFRFHLFLSTAYKYERTIQLFVY